MNAYTSFKIQGFPFQDVEYDLITQTIDGGACPELDRL